MEPSRLTSGDGIQGAAAARGSPAYHQDIKLIRGLQRQDLLFSAGEVALYWNAHGFRSLDVRKGALQRVKTKHQDLYVLCTHTHS